MARDLFSITTYDWMSSVEAARFPYEQRRAMCETLAAWLDAGYKIPTVRAFLVRYSEMEAAEIG